MKYGSLKKQGNKSQTTQHIALYSDSTDMVELKETWTL